MGDGYWTDERVKGEALIKGYLKKYKETITDACSGSDLIIIRALQSYRALTIDRDISLVNFSHSLNFVTRLLATKIGIGRRTLHKIFHVFNRLYAIDASRRTHIYALNHDRCLEALAPSFHSRLV